jgi:hypothetical protein
MASLLQDFRLKDVVLRNRIAICTALLHALGLDHMRLTYPPEDRDAGVTQAEVVHELLE